MSLIGRQAIYIKVAPPAFFEGFMDFFKIITDFFNEASPRTIAAHAVGFVALTVAVFVFLLKRRRHIIAAKLATDAIYSIHFALLGSYTASAINLIGVLRGAVFYNKERKWASSRAWCIFFVLLTLGSSALTWAGAISLLPAVGSSLAVVGLWSSSTLRLRILNLAGITLWLIYTVIIFSPAAIICNVIYVTTIIISLVKEIKETRQGKAN